MRAAQDDDVARLPRFLSQAKPESVRLREEAARERDRLAGERDAAADARDRESARMEAELREAGDLAAVLQRAAADRAAAAQDRALAAEDRRQAAVDRQTASAALAEEGIDPLTGALTRHVGLLAIERELERAKRSGEPVVIAYVDVIGLKRVNDSAGHHAGDALLCEVAKAICASLRAYDLVVRVGGDEFVCSLTRQDVRGATARFDAIAEQLARSPAPARFRVGFAMRRRGESLAQLMRRADQAMLRARRRGS